MNPCRKILHPLNTFLALGCAVFLNGCSQEDPARGNAVIPPSAATGTKTNELAIRAISIGDRIEIFVREDPSFNEIYSVRESGDIIIPKVGRITVNGLSVPEAEAKIKQTLEPDQLQIATVIVDRLQSHHRTPSGQPSIIIYLTGKVKAPGQHSIPVTGGMRIGLYEALLIGGGITKFGDTQKIHALRTGQGGLKTKISMNVRGINQGKSADIPAQSGDIIVVPERIFGF
ncbi:MAG: polysaccharide biosynthesis/export family protein [Verrucomicrobiales bacterium]|jgi:protein involved in polysaccharide export with SLBB domain